MLQFHKLQWQRADSILLFINQSNFPMLGQRRNLNASVTKEDAVPPSFPAFSPRLSLASHSRFPPVLPRLDATDRRGAARSLAVRLLSKFGFAIMADLTPSRRVHSLRLPCSRIDVARPQCCFEDVFSPLALTTPGPTTRLFQLSKEESLGDIHLPYASRGRTNTTEMLWWWTPRLWCWSGGGSRCLGFCLSTNLSKVAFATVPASWDKGG